jgi:hypothetical protein
MEKIPITAEKTLLLAIVNWRRPTEPIKKPKTVPA